MQILTSQLDSSSLAYLQEIERTRGSDANGVFVRRTYQASSPRDGWLSRAFFGLVALGIAALLCRPSIVDGANLQRLSAWQAGLFGLGILLLASSVRRLTRRVPVPLFQGAFLWADALHLWDVNPERVITTSLEELEDVDGYHNTINGFYTSSRVVLKFLGRLTNPEVQLSSRDTAEELLRFLNFLTILRRSSNEDTRKLMQTSPTFLGAVARRLASAGASADLGGLNTSPDLPTPREIDAPNVARAQGRRCALVPWLVGAVAAAVGVFGFPWLDHFLLDEHLYAQVPARDNGQFSALDHYLERFPDGRHSAEVRDLRDDRRYALAVHDAEGKHSPSFLRQYLADAENVRHRSEAQVRINRFYDEVIARLKERARTQGAKMDRQMFDAVLALLEALKKTDHPVVTIGFKATQDEVPKTKAQKDLEALIQEYQAKRYPELERMVKNSSSHTAILPLGEVFTPTQTARREQVILSRLRESVQKVLGADILTLEAAAPGQKPVMEVAYHTFAPGRLYVYEHTLTTTSRYGGAHETKMIKGLLRGYEVQWTITIHPPGAKESFDIRFPSSPASNLNYKSESGDPDWAPYAIILYSGFFDMSSRLIRNFALEPGAAPDSYTYGTVTGKK